MALSQRLLIFITAVATTALAGPAFKPDAPLSDVAVWTNANAKWFTYPESSTSSSYYLPTIDARPNFGIAVSGGGYRAATLALGYVRALNMMNLTSQARYLSSNSGGSWFNGAFSYQQVLPVNEFLGPYMPPEELAMHTLGQVAKGKAGAFATTISESSIIWNGLTSAVADVIMGSRRGPGAWSLSIGDAFLKPYDLNADKSTITANGTAGVIHASLQQLSDIPAYTYQAKFDNWTTGNAPRPFPIILGAIFSRLENSSHFYPVEFTPLYVGCPPVFPNLTDPNDTVGGGFVDPQGFNSAPPDPKPAVPPALAASLGILQNAEADQEAAAAATQAVPQAAAAAKGRQRLLLQVNRTAAAAAAPPAPGTIKTTPAAAAQAGAMKTTAPKPPSTAAAAANATKITAAPGLNAALPLNTTVNSSFIVPLKVMVGISSSFMAQGLTPERNVIQELSGTEELDYWNQVNFQGKQQPFADGGGIDNIAITPLLRRKVTHIVSCIAAVVHITENTTAEDWAVGQWDIAALFGAVPLAHPGIKDGKVNGMPPAQLNKGTQVFPSSGWAAMFKDLQDRIAQGGPVYHMATYTVLSNPDQAVQGGWQVNVLWVTNALQKKWEARLPPETQGTVAKSRFKHGGLFADNTALRDAAPDAGSGIAELKMFPYIATVDANYTPQLVGLLSQLASWQMLQLQPQLQKLLAGSGATVAPPSNVGTATRDARIGHPAHDVLTAGAKNNAGLMPAAHAFTVWLAGAAAAATVLLAL